MVAKLIVSALILIALAVLIVLNFNYRSTVNLFGAQFENVSVIVIAIAGFVLGVIYTVIIYVINLLNKRKKESQKKKREGLKQKEVELRQREVSAGAGEERSLRENASGAAGLGESAAPGASRPSERVPIIERALRRLRGKK